MATRSTISVVQDNGSVISIYCHWDGDLSGVGKTLIEHYNTKEKANELVALGALSSLGRYPKPIDETLPRHTFENAHKDVTVAYHRDRDEDFEQGTFPSMKEYKGYESYNYIFRNDVWSYLNDNGKFSKVTPAAIKRDKNN